MSRDFDVNPTFAYLFRPADVCPFHHHAMSLTYHHPTRSRSRISTNFIFRLHQSLWPQ